MLALCGGEAALRKKAAEPRVVVLQRERFDPIPAVLTKSYLSAWLAKPIHVGADKLSSTWEFDRKLARVLPTSLRSGGPAR